MAENNLLAIAVASGRTGYVLITGDQLTDWGLSVKATKSSRLIAELTQTLIDELKPDIVVTERCSSGCRKGKRTRMLIATVAELASQNPVLDVSVPRWRRYTSKYEEAQAIVRRHPALAGYQPYTKRRLIDFEPRAMVLFEAVSLAEAARYGPSDWSHTTE